MKQKFYFLCTLFWCTILSFGQTNATHLNFDGSNDYVSCGTTNLPTGTSARTIEAWIKTTQTTGVQSIINYGNQAIGNSRFGFLNASGILYFVGENNDYYTNTLIADGNWHHVAATYEASTLKIYIDGALNATVTKVLNTNNNFFNIGASCNPTPGDFFNGSIDEVRVWNTARTAEQINGSKNCELQGNEAGLVAYYNFNQGVDQANNSTVTVLTDATSNANNGTLTNFALNGATSNWLAGSPVTTGSVVPSVATVTTPDVYNQNDTADPLSATTGTNGTGLLWYTTATGGTGSATAPTPSTATVGNTSYWVSSTNANGCESARVEIVVTVNALVSATHLNFDGTNDVVTVPNSASLAFGTSNLTLEAMVKMSNPQGNYSGIITKATAGTLVGIQLVVVNNKLALEIGNGTIYGVGLGLIGTTNLNDNNWHHVSCVVDRTNNNIKLYVDGISEANITNAGFGTVNITTTTPLFIGKERNTLDFLESNIDEVRIWNTARTAEQINGSKNCELQGNETGLVAYYNFNQGVDQANNSTVTVLTDATSNANNGTLTNFALNGATSNWLAGSPITTGSVVPSVPTVTTPDVYNQNDTADPLSATTGTNGTGLLWYTTATGGTGSATAPAPSTATVGNTSYWVSSTNANGCESARVEIVVTVNALVSATHLNFDGTNDHVTIPATAINNLPQGTIETWVYLNSLNEQTICSKQSNGENSYAILAVGGGSYDQGAPIAGQVSYQSKNGSIIKSTGPLLQIGQWYHLAITFTNTQARLYINGVLNNTVNANFSLPNDLTVTATSIGAWLGDGGGQYFNGNIDEFRVWNVALSATDIANTMNCEAMSQPELIAYYKFNQGYDGVSNTGITSLTDSAGSNNGTLTNFALSGATSNWKSGSPVTTGNTCTTLDNSSFEAISNLKVYPNPSTGIFNISAQENVTIEVYDLVGKQIKTQEVPVGTSTIDISNYASGVYLLKATNTKGAVNNYKLIKQ